MKHFSAATATAAAAVLFVCSASAQKTAMSPHANRFDKVVAGVFEKREADWRNGPIVYQVLVDRFARREA